MTHDEELREQRQALNAAINKRDLETMRSFIHTSFVAKGKDGSSIDYEAMMQGAAQMLNSLKDFDSQVVVEDVDVSGDSAKLVVRRTERGRAHVPKNFWVFLGRAIMFSWLGIVDTVQKDFENAAGFAVACLVFIWAAFFWFRRGRSFHKTFRAQETWQSVDGHWLVVEEQELLPAGAPLAGHEYKSKVMLLGLPLIHVASGRGPDNRRRVAKGWIAFGDIACGVLFAAGGIAVGGLSLGVVSLAGLALGVFAFGGGAAGVWAVGGLALACLHWAGAPLPGRQPRADWPSRMSSPWVGALSPPMPTTP